jgi:hypothetical protein
MKKLSDKKLAQKQTEDIKQDYIKIVNTIKLLTDIKQAAAVEVMIELFYKKHRKHYFWRTSGSVDRLDTVERVFELYHLFDSVKKELFEKENISTEKEYILCAAILYGDTIISGYRHGDCYKVLNKLNVIDQPGRESQGFLTSLNRYVDRKEAWKIAKENKQIKFGLEASENGEESILISENLY